MADHLQGTMPTYLMTMDDNLAGEDQALQPRKHEKAVSGTLKTADNTVADYLAARTHLYSS